MKRREKQGRKSIHISLKRGTSVSGLLPADGGELLPGEPPQHDSIPPGDARPEELEREDIEEERLRAGPGTDKNPSPSTCAPKPRGIAGRV